MELALVIAAGAAFIAFCIWLGYQLGPVAALWLALILGE